jgi:RNA polymerase sigma-70 factor, ECF subfamily
MDDKLETSPDRGEVTRLLEAWNDGDEAARDRLMPLVFAELREIAERHFRREPEGHTLQPTALVAELYLRLIDRRTVSFKNRSHFFGSVSEMMRRILINHHRTRAAERRGGGVRPVPLDENLDPLTGRGEDLLELDDALRRLAEIHPRQAKGVELYYFIGLDNAEVAETLGISVTQVKRDFAAAKLWLQKELEPRA